LAFYGTYIWVVNSEGNSLTQLNVSTGAWIRTITGSNVQSPDALVVVGSNIWVANRSTGANIPFLSEFDASSGAIIRAVSGVQRGGWTFGTPDGLASSGNNIWVSDNLDNSIAEFSGVTGGFIRTTLGGPNLSAPTSVSSASGYVWVGDPNDLRADEYNASTGAYVRSIANVPTSYRVYFTGNYLFLNGYGSSEVQQYSSIGVLMRNVKSNIGGSKISTILFDGNNLWTANDNNSVTVHPL
jgi:hypothetical protein